MDYCNQQTLTLPKELEGVSSLRHLRLTAVKTGQYRPDLPTLRTVEMDHKLGKLTDEHSLFATLLTKAEFQKAVDEKSIFRLNRFTEPITSIDGFKEHPYDQWMTENKIDWEEFLKSDRAIDPLKIPFGNERFLNYTVKPTNVNQPAVAAKTPSVKIKPQDEVSFSTLLPHFHSKPIKNPPISLRKIAKCCSSTEERTCCNVMEQTKLPFQSKSNEIKIQAAMAKKSRMPFTKS